MNDLARRNVRYTSSYYEESPAFVRLPILALRQPYGSAVRWGLAYEGIWRDVSEDQREAMKV